MRKLFTSILAMMTVISIYAREVYIVGDSSPAGWSVSNDALAKTTFTEVSTDVYEWTGVLTKTTNEGFKIITQKDWNPAIHPSEGGLIINEKGSDVVALPYEGDPDTKWKISETAEYTIRVTFRETDVLVECIKAGAVSSTVPQVDGVYQISTAAHMETFAKDLNSGLIANDCSVVLTQDVDLKDITAWTAIGTDSKKFIGTFNGQGFRIKGMKLDSSKKEQGFFGVMGAGATVKNLIMDASCVIESNGEGCFAAFAGCCNLTGTITFENCGNEANVVGKAQNNASFLGCNYGNTKLVFNNCYNIGKISGGRENGAFSGWTGGGATFNNCYNIGEVTEGDTWARGNVSINNCYQTVGSNAGVTKVTADQVASGELCFKLNGDQSAIAWYQTLTGTIDTYPVPFSTSKKVYANGEMKCDGTAVEGGELTYSNESTSVIPDHQYENGFCKVCDKYQENAMTETDGWYVVSEPWQLRWMAQSVTNYNETYGKASIKLDADIDYTAYKSDLFGKDQSTAFRGIFDGQGKTITIDVINNGTSRTGLFAYINAATIKNLVVEGSATSADNNCVGGLGGRSDGDGTLVENIVVKTNVSYTGKNGDATCGGFFANMEGQITLKNCAFYGSIKTGTAEGNGGLVGWAGSESGNKYINCLVAPVEYTKNGNSAEFARHNPSVTNCFYTSANDAKLASGELAYKLGAAFRQTIGEDSYPVLDQTHGIVKQITSIGYATMFLPETSVAIPAGVEAFTGIIVGDYLTLKSLQKTVVKGQAVILKGNEGYYSFVPVEAGYGLVQSNLIGAATDIEAAGKYVLAQPENEKVGFYLADKGTIAAGKAYIVLPTTEVKAFYFAEEGATGIANVNVNDNQAVIYNMAGQRISKLQKGINIVNGKKVLY